MGMVLLGIGVILTHMFILGYTPGQDTGTVVLVLPVGTACD